MDKDKYIEWLTPESFEKIFGIKKSTQAKMRMRRVLPFSKFGKFIYYDRAEIDEHLKNHKVENYA
ncbi:MAG TPA: DNA-binding protein [Sulfurimonas autotrophica]|nr:DNA-binding protein [Sulfurimonas autotrophica]